jgi:hypothetical protein
MLQWQEKGSHGKKCPSGQRAADHPIPQRSETVGGHVHDKRIADATPYPLPAGSRLLQDLGFVAFTLPEVEILMPMKKPRGQSLTLDQQQVNQSLHDRRLRIEHVRICL